MKYSIVVGNALTLKVCVSRFETFEEAKVQMAKYIVDLISRQKDEFFNAWENFKEDFPEEIQAILISYDEKGIADFDDDISDEYGEISYCACDTDFEAKGKRDNYGCNLSISTDAINMYDPDQNYRFTLTEEFDGGNREITIELLVNDGDVEVFNVVPDDVRASFLEDDD